MKKICLILLVGMFLSAPALNAKNWRVGVAVGFDMADVKVTSQYLMNNSFSYEAIPSYNLNGYIGYKNNRFLGLSMEPGFIRKGGTRLSDINFNNLDATYEMNYFHMPVLLDLYLTKRISISAGPEIGYLFSAYIKTTDGRFDCIQLYDNQVEISGLFGIQYSLFKWFDIGLRYNHGLMYTSSMTYTNDIGDIIGDSKFYNQYWQLMLRLKI